MPANTGAETQVSLTNSGERIAVLETTVRSLERLGEERDKRYEERHESDEKAIAAALVAAEKAVNAALTAQKEAVTKAESSQTLYNQGHNDLQRKMEVQNKETLPRAEAEVRFQTQESKMADQKEEIIAIRLVQSNIKGTAEANTAHRTQSNWSVGLVVTILFSVLSLLVGVVALIIAFTH